MNRKAIVRSLLSVVGAMGLAGALVPSAAAAPPPWSPPGAGTEPEADEIALCCTWGTGITDGITYSIVGTTDQDIIDAITAGVEDWEDAINDNDVHFDLVVSGAEVTIRYKRGGGTVAGSTSRSGSGGFISGASMSISGKAFGTATSSSELTTVTSHEWGHVLGLNHANGSGLLMSPSLNSGSPTITACDRGAAEYVLDWIIDGGSTPIAPALSSFAC
jgi:hypothetical protein